MTEDSKYLYTQNRELSWLKFNERVLEEAGDQSVPLLERLKFVEIFTSNLDEFFMIRVGSLMDMTLAEEERTHIDNKSGRTPAEQLNAIFKACKPLYKERDRLFMQIEAELRTCNVCRMRVSEIGRETKTRIEDWFYNYIRPVLSPQIIDIHHPFPHLLSKSLNIIVYIEVDGRKSFGIIPVPENLPRALYLSESAPGIRYILIEDVILYYAEEVFDNVTVLDKAIFSVTRNADISPEDEAFDVDEDYREVMSKVIKKRKRLAPVRVEIQSSHRDMTDVERSTQFSGGKNSGSSRSSKGKNGKNQGGKNAEGRDPGGKNQDARGSGGRNAEGRGHGGKSAGGKGQGSRTLSAGGRLSRTEFELIEPNRKDKIIEFLIKKLGLMKKQVFITNVPLSMKYVYELDGKLTPESAAVLCNSPYTARTVTGPLGVDMSRKLIPQLLRHDALLHYPYESMDPFLQLIREASQDPDVVSIRITIYRLASKTRLVDYLCNAAENGKEVTVLMELRARFDEQNNIHWAERLEEAGCTMLYGIDDIKVHSKICLIARKNGDKIEYITQIGTGNYNEKTAKLYVDLCLITHDQVIGHDAAEFFRNLALNNLGVDYNKLIASPYRLRDKCLEMIDEEIAKGKDGYIFIKINSLTDRVTIDKLEEASRAGVEVVLNVRGICCLRPGIPGHTENIKVFSIVGRYLEHSRIYRFGRGEDAALYIASADFMTRNLERRVEIGCPVEDEAARKKIFWIIETYLSDSVKARYLDEEGIYHRARTADSDSAEDKTRLLTNSIEEATRAGHRDPRTLRAGICAQEVFMKEDPEFTRSVNVQAEEEEKADSRAAEPGMAEEREEERGSGSGGRTVPYDRAGMRGVHAKPTHIQRAIRRDQAARSLLDKLKGLFGGKE